MPDKPEAATPLLDKALSAFYDKLTDTLLATDTGNTMEDTAHFITMLHERDIKRSWVDSAVLQPDMIEDYADGTRHYLKEIPEYGNRWLRVVVNAASVPNKRVTAFFDRRLRRDK